MLDHASLIFPRAVFCLSFFLSFFLFCIDCAQFITGGIFRDNIACQPLIGQVGDLKDGSY